MSKGIIEWLTLAADAPEGSTGVGGVCPLPPGQQARGQVDAAPPGEAIPPLGPWGPQSGGVSGAEVVVVTGHLRFRFCRREIIGRLITQINWHVCMLIDNINQYYVMNYSINSFTGASEANLLVLWSAAALRGSCERQHSSGRRPRTAPGRSCPRCCGHRASYAALLSSLALVREAVLGTMLRSVSRKRSILEIWCMEQKVFVLTQLVDIWSEPARPGPALPDRHAFERLITRKLSIIQKKVIRHKMFVNFIRLMYSTFRKILQIVFEL